MTPIKQPATKILLGFGAAVLLGMASAWGQTYSHARIVRLSFVEGDVTIQRPDITEWAEAPMNTPLQEGFKLSTAEGSFAEVEFENGSTVRLGQLSLLEFTQLALASDGSKIDRLTLRNGYATFHAFPEGQDIYEVFTPNATLTPRGKAMFRVDTDSSEERVEVSQGSVEVASPLGSWTLSKNAVLDLGSVADQPIQLSEGITQDDWDRWVQERESAAEAANSSMSPSAYSSYGSESIYGWSDLANYGTWTNISGFGYGWVPNVGAGWYPYWLGRWCWYPGFGWVWISADPWGWLPYHYGGWEFIPGIGWVWFPGIFGAWSPGLVVWYGGQGWIGWRPRHGLPGGGRIYPCPEGQSCATAVSTETFRKGHRVGPSTTLDVNVASGNRMDRPDIQPNRQARLPGPAVTPPARSTDSKVTFIRGGDNALTSHPQPGTPTPGEAEGSSGALAASAVGSPARHAAPAPVSGIIYDPAAGRYVNGSRLPSEATQAQNELSTHPLSPAPGASTSFAAQPAPRTRGGPAPDVESHGKGWSHQASPRSDSSSAAAPRSGGAAPSSQTKGGGSSGGHSTSGAGTSGGGGTGGGGHGGGSGGGGSSGGGGHH
jgi:hypothetical protein